MVASIHSTDIQPHYVGRPWTYSVMPNDKLRSGDLVYLIAGQSGLYGFGYVTKIGPNQDPASEDQMIKVTVSRPVMQEGLVSSEEINREPEVDGIVNRLDGNFVELSPKQTNMLNKLMRSHGSDAPDDVPEILDVFDKFGIRDETTFQPKLRQAVENHNLVSVLFADLDNFKAVNGTYGHDAGNDVLRATFEIVEKVLQDKGELFHPHGDEMIILLADLNDAEARKLAEDIRVTVERHNFPNIGRGFVSTTIGFATYPDTCKRWEDLKKEANLAAMRAKKVGKNIVANCIEKLEAPPIVSDADIAQAQLKLKRIDALNEGRPMADHDEAKIKLQKIFTLEPLVERLKAEGRPAAARKLERQINAIQNEGRVATTIQRKVDRLNDLAAEEMAMAEDERRKKNER